MSEEARDIFAYSEDLPSELKDELNWLPRMQRNIYELFKEANRPLSLKELAIGYYRRHDHIWKLGNLSTQCQRLKAKGFITNDGLERGHYAATRE